MGDEAQFAGEVGLFGIWLLGLSVGLTACTAACLPFMSTWVVGQGRGGFSAFKDTLGFALGKVGAYALLGMAAGLAGEIIVDYLSGPVGHIVIGLASIFGAVWLFKVSAPKTACDQPYKLQRFPPFVMGFALSFTPCAPLSALLFACAYSGDPWLGLSYGAVFGLGSTLTPLLIVMPAIGVLGKSLRRDRPWIGAWLRYGAVAVFLALGTRRLWLATLEV